MKTKDELAESIAGLETIPGVTVTVWGEHGRRPTVPPEPLTLDAIAAEVTRARLKFPGNRHLLAALTEEVGELAQALLQGKPRADVVLEAIQVACVAVRIIEEGDASFAALTDEERQA